MLTYDQMEKNRLDYVSAINLINREYFDKDAFLDMLTNSDFFSAPASTKYHCAYSGGLCEHSLNVWHCLVNLDHVMETNLDPTSMLIVALCHDLAKINYYTKDFKNKKVYSSDGSKSDSNGKYDWVTVPVFVKKDSSDRLIYGSHEINSEMIAHEFIPLTREESIAILHHHGGRGWDSAQDDISEIFNYSKLACLLHLADMLSTYITEASSDE